MFPAGVTLECRESSKRADHSGDLSGQESTSVFTEIIWL